MANQNTLIIANPGTGKTTTLVNKAIELLKKDVKGKDILCITFTKKAANEMHERIHEHIDELVENDKVNSEAKNIAVHTFHSYAYSYLKDIGKAKTISTNNRIRYSILKSFLKSSALTYSVEYIITDIVPKTENAIRYLKSFGILPHDINLNQAMIELRKIYNDENITNITLEENNKFFEYFLTAFEDYESDKDADGCMDYNDILMEFIKRREKEKSYKFVLVDELQDVNEIEAKIASDAGETLFLVGDRKQAIFGFQGGSLENFSKLKNANNVEKKTLTLNYRSFQEILDYSKKHFLKHTKDSSYSEELSNLSSSRDGEAIVSVLTSENTIKTATSKLIKFIRNDETNSTYAIIARTNGQINSISKILDLKGVKYRTTTGGYVDNEAKKEMISYIRGMLYDDKDSLIHALFTPFSGITLKEAFAVSEKINKNEMTGIEYAKMAAKTFFDFRENLRIDRLLELFTESILPISVSIGKEYYLSASSLYKSIKEFFDMVERPTRENFFNYLQITEDNYEPMDRKNRVMLTTVHKAKGLEFDNVIYVPKGIREKISFIDAMVYAIIKDTKGIDVKEELEEEHLRVDFVAFTRARNALYVITDRRNAEWYATDAFDTAEALDTEDEDEPLSRKYDESYSLFVNRRYDEAKIIISNHENWLPDVIYSYFNKPSKLSFTNIEESKDVYSFLKDRILGISKYKSKGSKTGTDVHQMAERIYRNELDEDTISKEYLQYFHNLNKLNKEVMEKYGARQISSEEKMTIDLKDLFIGEYENIKFTAKFDAIYEFTGNDGTKNYLILDYKTNKKDTDAPKHRRQLAVYKKVYAKKESINENKISVAIGFIGLRGNVNTGNVGWRLDDSQPRRDQIIGFKKSLDKYVEYVKTPDKFIEALLNKDDKDPLSDRIRDELSKR